MSAQEAINTTIARCQNEYGRCFVFSTSDGVIEWARRISDNGGVESSTARANTEKKTDFLSGFSDAVRGFSGAVGAAAALTGVRRGDSNLSNQGTQLLAQSLADRPAPPPAAQSLSAQASTNAVNLSLPAFSACQSKVLRIYAGANQNTTLKAAACQYYCAHLATKYNSDADSQRASAEFYKLYIDSQRKANSLCSLNISANCNDIVLGSCQP